MTTLVALHQPGFGTVIGSDRMASNMAMKHFMPGGKWVVSNGWAIGAAGNYLTNVLISQHIRNLTVELDGVADLAGRLAQMMKEAGYNTMNEDNGPALFGQNFLAATVDGVWDIDGSMAYMQGEPGQLVAAGSGEHFALGAGFANARKKPIERIEEALRAALQFDTFSGGEPWIAVMRPEKEKRRKDVPLVQVTVASSVGTE